MANPLGHFSFNHIDSATVGTIVYPPGGRYGPRIQQDIQLVLLHTGAMEVTIDGVPFRLEPGNVALLKPGHIEHFTFADEQESWHRWIAVQPLSVDEVKALEQVPFSLPISEHLNRITDLMLSIRSEHADTGPVMRSLGHTAIQLFLSELSKAQLQQDIHPSVLRAKAYIHQTFKENLSLPLIAAHAGVSDEHLVRLFRKYEQTTPIKYVWHYRVLRAVELLSQTGLSISEIAQRSGFQTSYHFARQVKQQTGKTPSEIRTSSWEKGDIYAE
ncbi:helix-turn-helix domain-containing protein [Paenibacillus alginolyticus]|uniref:AraC family transcriptional regulator n=1 Tax=Paenibacillus alginolyticus TaxID=59839 RepID=A0ABT4G6Q2_9BACL|nr:AraC family transcriptional regulator [Paenibacillus alginolyticus]MCY9691859.1 AraC family transcriptional regulator [Paenibacillus alginolyticus]MEC0142151.1 AraC family transcriptional regulator [Paenibacillus alginolyticus]